MRRYTFIVFSFFAVTASAQQSSWYYSYECGDPPRDEVYPNIRATKIFKNWTGGTAETLSETFTLANGQTVLWPMPLTAERIGRHIRKDAVVVGNKVEVSQQIRLQSCYPTNVGFLTKLPDVRWENYPKPTVSPQIGDYDARLYIVGNRLIPRNAPTHQDQLSITTLTVKLPPSTPTEFHADNVAFKTQTNFEWLPARYEGNFQFTCYISPQEGHPAYARTSKTTTAAGISAKLFRSAFLEAVRMNGSGQDETAQWIRWDTRTREFQSTDCPRTATNACAVDGQATAVDRKVIPLRSAIATKLTTQNGGSTLTNPLGVRTANDTGGGIKGKHIDLYFGARYEDCKQWGVKQGNVLLVNY